MSHVDVVQAAAAKGGFLVADELGVPKRTLARMAREGELERLCPGVYISYDTPMNNNSVYAAAWSVRYPNTVVGLLSAAVIHDITDAFARGAWLLHTADTARPRFPTNAVQVPPHLIDPDLDEINDIRTFEAHGTKVRITGPMRTTLDLFRCNHRISYEHQYNALRRLLFPVFNEDCFDEPAFIKLAERLGVWKAPGTMSVQCTLKQLRAPRCAV